MTEFTKDLEDYFCRFTFGQFVTLILVEIVTLFFIFYLGARYGTDLLGARTREASATRSEGSLPKEGSKNVDDIVGSPHVDYTYPEVLTQEGNKAIRVKPSGVTAAEYDKKAQGYPSGIVEKLEKPLPVERVEPVEKAEPVANAESATPVETSSEESVSDQGQFSIQVGSYPSEEEANQEIGRWKRKRYSVFMTTGEIPEKGTWYRVRLGHFPSREKANDYLSKLQSKEKVKGLVVSSES